MIRGSLSPPPQMGNGGSPPAHLSTPYLSDPSWWLHIKWSQPSPRTPDWLFDYYDRYNPPPLDTFGRPLRIEEWHQRAVREDRQAAGLLAPGLGGGPILHGFYARAERAYTAWKGAIDDLWAYEQHRLVEEQAAHARQEESARARREEATARARREEAAARARNEEAARARNEAAARARNEAATQALARIRAETERALRCRHETERALVRERTLAEEATARTRQEEAARARQEATARARQEATARTRQEKAAARANEAARTIFLWLRRRRLHARLLASLEVAVPADTRLCPQTAEAQSPDLVPAEIRRIQAARDTLAAPLDALLAEFAALAVGTASPATASPVPTPSPRPRSYLDAVVGPNGRGYTSSAPPSPSVTTSHPSASAPPTPTVCTTHRAKPRHRTGRRNIPRAPSSYAAVAPTHPALLQGGLPTPTFITLARATSLCRSVVSSPTPASTTPHAPSLHPFTFDDGTILSSGGGNAHPFHARGLPLPPWKRTRRKYRPHRTCRRHQPRAPNHSSGWA